MVMNKEVREEFQRLYQNAGLLHADETLLLEMTIQQDIDEKEFACSIANALRSQLSLGDISKP